MRTFTLNDTITPRRMKQLIKRIELCKSKTINLYLCSHGGETMMSDIFIDFTRKTKKKINLIGVEAMVSACMFIFMDAKGEKSLLPNTIAMIHFASVGSETRDLLNKKSHDSFLVNSLKKSNEERLHRYAEILDLSDNEKRILKRGGDLMLDYQRLKKQLHKINKHHYEKT